MSYHTESLLTIIIPSYNHELYIKKCLEEVARISIQINLIIIDDGSTDNTSSIIKNFIKTQNISIEFIQKKNSGLVSSLNIGLKKVKTKFVYFIASDDIPNPKEIVMCINILKKEDKLKFIIGGAENFFLDGSCNNTYRKSHQLFFNLNNKNIKKKLFLDYPKPLLLQSSVFKTEALKAVNGWDKEIILDDYSMFTKLLLKYKQYDEYLFSPKTIVCQYRQHENNSSKDYYKQYLMVKQVIYKYAPTNIKFKATGYRLGFYIMLCIKEKKYFMLRKLLQNSNIYELFWSIIIIPTTYYKYIKKRL